MKKFYDASVMTKKEIIDATRRTILDSFEIYTKSRGPKKMLRYMVKKKHMLPVEAVGSFMATFFNENLKHIQDTMTMVKTKQPNLDGVRK